MSIKQLFSKNELGYILKHYFERSAVMPPLDNPLSCKSNMDGMGGQQMICVPSLGVVSKCTVQTCARVHPIQMDRELKVKIYFRKIKYLRIQKMKTRKDFIVLDNSEIYFLASSEKSDSKTTWRNGQNKTMSHTHFSYKKLVLEQPNF